MYPEVNTLREPTAGGALLNSRRDCEIGAYSARDHNPLAARIRGSHEHRFILAEPSSRPDEAATVVVLLTEVNCDFKILFRWGDD
jgi:hypothetical protein